MIPFDVGQIADSNFFVPQLLLHRRPTEKVKSVVAAIRRKKNQLNLFRGSTITKKESNLFLIWLRKRRFAIFFAAAMFRTKEEDAIKSI